MDEDTASRFVSSLVKSIQALCNGYIDFTSSIEVIGHIHLNIDRTAKFNYVLTEEVSKSVSEGATLFASHSYHSQPPPSITNTSKHSADSPRHNRRKSRQVPRVDDSDTLDIATFVPVPDVPSVEPDNCFSLSRLGEGSGSSPSRKVSVPQDSALLLNVKPEKQPPAATHIQDGLDRRRKNASSHEMLSVAAKRSRNNNTSAAPAIQNPGFDVIEIKEEPDEEPSDSIGDSSSHYMAAGQGDSFSIYFERSVTC